MERDIEVKQNTITFQLTEAPLLSYIMYRLKQFETTDICFAGAGGGI